MSHTPMRVVGLEPTQEKFSTDFKSGASAEFRHTRKYLIYKSVRQDSNLRLPEPKSGALTKLSHAPMN